MSGLRSQAAPLPKPSALMLCALAYQSGNAAKGDSLFREAYVEILPLVRATVYRQIDSREDREDAVQAALTAIWKRAQRGHVAAIELYARGAAIDRFRREKRHDHNVAEASVGGGPVRNHDDWYERRDDDDFARTDHHQHDPTDTLGSLVEVERMVRLLAKHRMIWGDIAMCLAAGLTQAETALALKRPRGTITRNVVEMRHYLQGEAA